MEKAQQAGYTNLKGYQAGLPGWKKNKLPVHTDAAWLAKNLNEQTVILDVRDTQASSRSHIQGAVALPLAFVLFLHGLGLAELGTLFAAVSSRLGRGEALLAVLQRQMAQQHAFRSGLGNQEVVTGETELFSQSYRKREDASLRYVDDRLHNSIIPIIKIHVNRFF